MSSADERLVEAKGLVEAAGDFYVADSVSKLVNCETKEYKLEFTEVPFVL